MDVDDRFAAAIASRYQIERELGQGGMAIVYLARDLKHRRQVALKVLRPELSNSLGAERFLQEIAISARLVHPNILPLHDSGEAAGCLYYVMPYVEGATLRQRLDREVQLPLDDVVGIVRQIASALDFAHARGVVHRDVKPDNVLLVDGHVLVADFGLAKALSSAASTPLTEHGTVVGTPAYMSPEQCSASGAVDVRSDVYSLACVTFEMIAGVTPFRGATVGAMIAHHLGADPPSIRAERASCPAALDEVMKRALAKLPADRYQHAGDFATALAAAVAGGAALTPGSVAQVRSSSRRGRRWAAMGVLALGAVLVGWVVSQRALGARPALDRNTYAVFPLRSAGPIPNDMLDGQAVARHLHDAMARWSGVHLVQGMLVSDLWMRRRPQDVDEALRAAESLHAGSLAWGEVLPVGDSLEIRVVAFDVARGSDAAREFRGRVARDAANADSVFAALADSIVVTGTGLTGTSALGSRSLPAREQFEAGMKALDQFDLSGAERGLRAAVQTDDSFAEAHLWLARTLAWGGEVPPSAWLGDASRAAALSARLPEREAAHAMALRDLADGHAPEACRRYRALVVSDSTDFAAWLGLGDCNSRDDAVVRSARSPTGYAFRGSYSTAIAAYRRALALVPSFHLAQRGLAFQRLSRRVLYTEESRPRRGIGVQPDTQTYIAFPTFAADTLAFLPLPYGKALLATSMPPTERQAVLWCAETYRQLTKDWVDAFPTSADAQAAYSSALETLGDVTGAVEDLRLALEFSRRAVRGADSPDTRVIRTTDVARLLIKMDSLSAAARLIDSTLKQVGAPDANQAGYLASMATLTGRATKAASLAAIAAGDSEHVPFVALMGRRAFYAEPVTASALELRVYASLGGPRDSIRATFNRASRMIDSWIPPAERDDARRVLFRGAYGSAYAQLAPIAPLPALMSRDPMIEMQIALQAHDTAGVRRVSRALAERWSQLLPGTMGTDALYQHAAMLLAIGDSAAAIAELDGALSALPRVRSVLLEVPPQAGAVGRAMLLRAQLAEQRDDRTTAQRWLRSVRTLWSAADPELRAPIEELQQRLSSPR
jgi:eukaryotic-like serine/threonine-protein kinase